MEFSHMEYAERLRKTKELMMEKGIDVLLITDPANMNYISGYDAWSFYVHQMLVVVIDENQPFWIGRGQDANAAKITTWLFEDHIIPYPDHYVQSEIIHPMDFVADILNQIGQGKRTIGVEMDAYYFTARSFQHLKAGLPNANLVNGDLIVNKVRMIKSDQEIEYMKKAAKLVEIAMQAGINTIHEGVRECDVVAEIYHAQIKGTDEFGGDYPSIVPLLPSGEKTSTPHLTWTDQTYKNGDNVIVELAGCYKRYHSPLARTVNLGPPSERLQNIADIVIEGINVTLDAIKPGITCEEVEEVWRKSIEKNGLTKDSRIGYSTGVNYPPDWGEHTASLRKGDKTILQPNMTFHLIPGIWLDNIGFEVSETLRVTETGCETLANFSRELFVVDNLFFPKAN
jgi:ectoine hydrolase